MNVPDTHQKITPDHLARKAVVYLRQSSLQQVKQNKQSQRLQYGLVDRAKAYWRRWLCLFCLTCCKED